MEFGSFQTGFLPGRQSGESTWAVRRVLELANEWGREAVVLHIVIMRSLYSKRASNDLLKATYQSLNRLDVYSEIGQHSV